MRKYKIVWDNSHDGNNYPLFVELASIVDVFDCLRVMDANAKNVLLGDEDDLMYRLSLLYNGDCETVDGTGFMVTAVNVR